MKDELGVMWGDLTHAARVVGFIALQVIGLLGVLITVAGVIAYCHDGWRYVTLTWVVSAVVGLTWALWWWRESARKRIKKESWV